LHRQPTQKLYLDIISASKGSNWFKALDNPSVNTVGGNNVKDGINGPKFGLIVDELNKAKTVADQIKIWQKYLKDPTILTGKGLDAAKKAFNTWMVDGKLPTNVQAVLSKDPLATLPALPLAQLNYNKDNPASVTAYADALKATYKDIKKADGTPAFTSEYLDSVAKGIIPQSTFDTKINDLAIAAATKDLKAQGISLDDVGGVAGLTKSGGLADYINNPNKLSSSVSPSSESSQDKTGIGGLLPVGSFKDDKGNFVYNGGEIPSKNMSEFVQTYNNQGIANRGAYVAPTFNSDTKMYESKSTSPYANALTSLLGSTKNPFASDYKSSLAQPVAMTSTQLANLNKPFEKNVTARDIINLQNSAGLRTGNELTKGSSLSKNLLGLYQTNPDGSAINSPWVADTEDMVIPTTTIPTIDTSTELVQLDPGGLLHGSTVVDPNLAINQDTAAGIDTLTGKSTIAGNAGIDTLSGSTVGGPAVNPRTGKPNYTVRNPTGFTANDLQLMEAMGWTPEQLKANNEQFAIERAKEADAYASSQRISNIIDSWKTPEDRWKWFAENPNDPYTLMAKEDITLPANYMTPPVVTDKPVVTNTSGVNPGTPAEIEARRIATDKLIAEQQAAEELRKKDLQQKMSQFSLTKVPETSQPIYVPPTTLTKIPETETSQPFNAGIVTPNVTSIVSPNNMSTFTLGPNGETGIPINLSPANTANQNAGITSLTGQQLENQAVNAGYQGDYTDTAAMQGYLSSLPR